jgi:hypothetical protein
LDICCVDFLDEGLKQGPGKVAGERVALNEHTECVCVEFVHDTDFKIIIKNAGNVIALVIIESQINPVGVSVSFPVLIFGYNKDG